MTSDHNYETFIAAKLAALREQGLYRNPPIIEGRAGTRIVINNRELINFCSNDYLGLAQNPKIQRAMSEAAERYGTGSSASPLICGKTALHQKLEQRIAEMTGRDRALLFNCGYMANLAVVTTMSQGTDVEIHLDRLCHASLIDGVIASGSHFRRYPHLDLEVLNNRLKVAPEKRKLVLTESVFSMDGDIAPLDKISQLCREYGAILIVDDAHGMGVLGKNGHGALEHFNLGQEQAPLLMGTFGKALGVHGAFVAGKADYIDLLIQRARPYIYSTSLPVPVVAAVLVALEIVSKEHDRRTRLYDLISYFSDRAAQMEFAPATKTPIQPLIIGSAHKTMEVCSELEKHGIFVMGIRPPTVAKGKSRLRITLNASHSLEELEHLMSSLNDCKLRVGF
jgi:8-amino-7-oxononanoate synthase